MSERRHPEVTTTRDSYERDYLHRTTEVRFYRNHVGSLSHVETLTRPEAEALLHQLEVHLYGGADAAGYTRPAAERLRVTLPGVKPYHLSTKEPHVDH